MSGPHEQHPPYGAPPAHGQAPYGQPPYDQPPYGQPPYGQPPSAQPGFAPQMPYGYPATPPTNTMAILSLVFCFVFWPLAIVFGFMAKSQIRRTGEGGGVLATVGIAIGFTFLGLTLLAIVAAILVAAVATGSSTSTSTSTSISSLAALAALR